MKTLEEILQEYMDCKRPIGVDGEITTWGAKSYDKLISLLYDLVELTGEVEVQEVVKELDKIYGE